MSQEGEPPVTLSGLRRDYHAQLFRQVVRVQPHASTGVAYPNFADVSNAGSIAIAAHIVAALNHEIAAGALPGQTSGGRFETITREFLENCFRLFSPLRPGLWRYSTGVPIHAFDQYEHLSTLARLVGNSRELASTLGTDYLIKPDIVVSRAPWSDTDLNAQRLVLDPDAPVARLTPMRAANVPEGRWLLHASISCKWTLRSDRAQNARAEALNLIRHRKGHLPHIVAVTAEPLPTRINALALGTGDLDCVYHFALPELQAAVIAAGNQDQQEALAALVEGRRLRDISDLPFDLLA